MSKLFDFLHPIADKEEKEVIISKRFVKRDNDGNVILDEDGKAVLQAVPHPRSIAGGERSHCKIRDQDPQRPEWADGTRFR